MVCTNTSMRSTRIDICSTTFAMAYSSSSGLALRSAAALDSLARIGPRPARSQSAFTSRRWHSVAMNSTLGACPERYRLTVSGLCAVKSPIAR